MSDYKHLSDAELVTLVRSGETDAYSELWRRHSSAAMAAARSVTSTFDPGDLVSEAYTRVFTTIQKGGGPTTAFRAYLLRSVHNIAIKWSKRPRAQGLEDIDVFEDPHTTDDSRARDLDRDLSAVAFRTLPARWQEVLWYVEVEEMKAQDLTEILGLSANGVAALTYRAREGLKQAWIQAHLNTSGLSEEHRWTVERLGAYTRGGLRKREQAKVTAHLADCEQCQQIASTAEAAGSQLAQALLPIAIGVSGTAGYLTWVASNGAPTTVQAMGAGGLTEEEDEQPRRRHRRYLIIVLLLLLIAAVIGIAIASSVLSESAKDDVDTAGQPPSAVSPPTADPTTSPSPSPVPSVTPPNSTPSPGPPSGPPERDAPRDSRPLSPPPAVDPPQPLLPTAAPILDVPDTGTGAGAGHYLPILSGQATPGATVTISTTNGNVSTIADANGRWTTLQLPDFVAGEHEISVQQQLGDSLPSAITTGRFQIAPPPAVTASGGDAQFAVSVSGEAGQQIQVLADGSVGWATAALPSSGTWAGKFRWYTTEGTHTLAVRYGTNGRWGPSQTTTVTISR